MKDTIIKYLKIFLVAATVVLIVLLVFGLVLVLGWPWWLGLVLLLVLGGVGAGILFLRKILHRRREQTFVQQVIAQDEAQLKAAKGKERDELTELQDRWKEAVQSLRSSHLRKGGNPLYTLPWYLVMGESGSGKTTAINSAKLSSPFAERERTSGLSGTRNCDWWFFEQAIILDTAGRYAIPVNEDRDKEEWRKFLTLLVKYRKKEPINGLIVSLASDKLLGSSPEALEEDGRTIRRRVDELMIALGIKFPIYLLITKCDLIQGMTQYCGRLSEKSLDQPMGVINQDLSTDVAAFLDAAMTTICERLRNHRVLLLQENPSKIVDPRLLLFPEEFENLKKGLESFMKGAFLENPYQETPILRGLYFSSGRQEGSPYSHFLSSLGLIGEKEVLPGTSKGLFLHDFFEKVLPQDRRLFAPTKRVLEWRLLTRNLGLVSWVLLGVAMCGLLSFSFVKNLRTLREISHEFTTPPVLKGEFGADLTTLNQFNKAVLRVEAQNRNWWIPRFGLYESKSLEQGLKEKFCNQFQAGFLIPFDKKMSSSMAAFAGSASDELIIQYVPHLARRINLLKARLNNEPLAALKEMPQPPSVSVMSTGQGTTAEERQVFGSLYLYYILWRSDSGEINKEIVTLQSWLQQVLSLRGNNLQWLAAWVNRQGTLKPVTPADFWGGSRNMNSEKSIPPSMTRKGKEAIDAFYNELETALPGPAIIAPEKKAFEKWYRTAAFEAWQDFAATFPEGMKRLSGEKEWRQTAETITSDQGAYASFINKIAFELEPLSKGEELPPWLDQLYRFQSNKSLVAKLGFAGKAAEEGKKLLTTIEKTIGKESGEMSEPHISAAMALNEYTAALSAAASVEKSRPQAYQTVVQVYADDPSASKSPLVAAYSAAAKLKSTMMKGSRNEDIFWKLVSGPADYLWIFARVETACYLQNQWEEKVLSEVQGTGDQQSMQILMKQDGPVWKFVNGPAAPFLGWKEQRGYYPKETLAGAVPFEQSFLSFLNKGAATPKMQRQSYSVTIKGLPTDANREARIKPHGTRLEVQCTGGGPQNLINLHYPISKTFLWSPETCGSVLFQIEVSDLVLTKKYEGPRAFPNFLQDFGSDGRTFFPREFPSEQSALERMGIKYIKVNYQLSGDLAEIRQYTALPTQVPRKIVSCWE